MMPCYAHAPAPARHAHHAMPACPCSLSRTNCIGSPGSCHCRGVIDATPLFFMPAPFIVPVLSCRLLFSRFTIIDYHVFTFSRHYLIVYVVEIVAEFFKIDSPSRHYHVLPLSLLFFTPPLRSSRLRRLLDKNVIECYFIMPKKIKESKKERKRK